MSGHITLSICWACTFGDHYEDITVHTWMDKEDAEHQNLPWPLSPELTTRYACNCTCAGGRGRHVPLGGGE